MSEAIIHGPGPAAAERRPAPEAGPWPGPRLEARVPTAPDLHAERVLATARRVLRTEAEAILQLAGWMPEDFPHRGGDPRHQRPRHPVGPWQVGPYRPQDRRHAVEHRHAYLLRPSGRGEPRRLGAVTSTDLCIVVSNSGETAELSDMIGHARRFGIPLVGIGSRLRSTMMEAADLRLVLLPAEEACVMGLAPTTSTTVTLSLGDALAVALMERRGFATETFRTYHPGGSLGARLAKVGQLMRGAEHLPLVGPDTPMTETILVMTAKGVGVAGVIEHGRLIGVVTDGDLRCSTDRLLLRSTREVATWAPVMAQIGMLAAEAVALMNRRKVHVLFVVRDDAVPIGLLHLHDCLRAGVA